MSDVRGFLESLFPQVDKQRLIELIHLYKSNITDIVNHIISDDDDHEDEDEIDTLRNLFPSATISDVQTAWIESNGRLHLAAQYLCENVNMPMKEEQSHASSHFENPCITQIDDSNNIYILMEMFPDHSMEFLSSILQDHGFDHGISLLLDLDKSCKGDCIDSGFPCLMHSSNTSYNHNITNTVKLNMAYRRPLNEFKYILPPISRSEDNASFQRSELDENEIAKGSAYLRKMAQEARNARNDAYRKASSTWKNNNITAKSSASYYGQQGRTYHNELCKWNSYAVEALLRENSSPGVLDLHGFTVQEAIEVLPRVIKDWKQQPLRKFKIIVGRGNRSSTGSRLGPAVRKWLTDERIRFESEPGSFDLVLK